MLHDPAAAMRCLSTYLAVAVLGLAGALGFGACKSSEEIFAANFDQACTKASDCVVVFEGSVGCCFQATACGGNAAINVSALASYEAEASVLETQACQGQAIGCFGRLCPETQGLCVHGTCAAPGGG